jgi:hypothetical protein
MTGFELKRQAAQDKLQDDADTLTIVYQRGFADGKKAAQPEQQAEPVAWITPDGEGWRIRFSPPTIGVPLGWDALYTAAPAAQRPWQGLTDEEILRADPWMGTSDSDSNPYQILLKVRTLEAKLKERNHG